MKTYKALLISNQFELGDTRSYFPTTIRVGTCSKWNHCAILELVDGALHRVIEANEQGVIATPYLEWWGKKDRLVWERDILVELEQKNVDFVLALVGLAGYGLFDIPQLAKYIVLARWLGRDYEWDGITGTGLIKGVVCSELLSLLFGDAKAHLRFPEFYAHPYDSRLSAGRVYRTPKALAKVAALA